MGRQACSQHLAQVWQRRKLRNMLVSDLQPVQRGLQTRLSVCVLPSTLAAWQVKWRPRHSTQRSCLATGMRDLAARGTKAAAAPRPSKKMAKGLKIIMLWAGYWQKNSPRASWHETGHGAHEPMPVRSPSITCTTASAPCQTHLQEKAVAREAFVDVASDPAAPACLIKHQACWCSSWTTISTWRQSRRRTKNLHGGWRCTHSP